MPDIDGYQLFKKTWLGLVNVNDPTTVFFRSTEFQNVSQGHNPTDLLQTFQILGTNENNQ